MALNDYVTLGRSGLRVSPFCLGAMTFGEDWGWGASVAESESILPRFLERGLRADHVAALDALSQPPLNFPAAFLRNSAMIAHNGATVNGERSAPWPMSPKSDAERY